MRFTRPFQHNARPALSSTTPESAIGRLPDTLWLLTSYAELLTDEFPRYNHAEVRKVFLVHEAR